MRVKPLLRFTAGRLATDRSGRDTTTVAHLVGLAVRTIACTNDFANGTDERP